MKQIEHRPRKNCLNCGIRFVFGSMFEDWDERLKEMGLRKVYGLYPKIEEPDLTLKIEECDGLFMSDIIHSNLTCPNCGTGALEAVEVEYADQCLNCGCTRNVRAPMYFIAADGGQPVNWVCTDCPDEPEDEEETKVVPNEN